MIARAKGAMVRQVDPWSRMRNVFVLLVCVAGCDARVASSVADASDARDASAQDASTAPVDATAVDDAAADAPWQAPPTCASGYVIDPNAKIGCRSPNRPGCGTCCTPSGMSCIVRSWAPGGVTDAAPWYNDERTLRECPSGCALCASCLDRSETELCDVLPAIQTCDCSIPSGPDPCEQPSTCACACERYDGTSRDCPRAR